ncbi:MAG: sodium-dependent transporter [Lachnospiraceae bacterium]|nr:sodium-dependent transporter [Lachnospiraceae bacterium]
MEKSNQRANFSSKIGFVLAAASSAVGLGNLWRFPYLAAKYGGGIFLLVYLVLAVTFGFAMMVTEISIGRMTKQSAWGAFQKLDKRFAWCGVLGLIIPMIITPYYCVIGGWVMKYMTIFAVGDDKAAAKDGFFGAYVGQTLEPLIWMTIFIVLTAVVVIIGVQKGIEKASTILMPILIALSVIISIYVVTRPGAMGGILYYIRPDFSQLNIKTVLAALGQLFYSMSLAMGIMITYGSYMKGDENLESSARQIEFFDTLIAFLAGLMIVPAVYIFSNGDKSAMSAGAGLMFITLPKVFFQFPGGRFIGMLFFFLVFFAALTSSISLMEAIVSVAIDKLHWSRKKATIIIMIYFIILGIPSSLGFGVWSHITPLGMDLLDFFDFVSNSFMMPILAFGTTLYAGFFLKPKAIIAEVEKEGNEFKAKGFYSFLIRWICPIGIIGIWVTSMAASLGFMSW